MPEIAGYPAIELRFQAAGTAIDPHLEDAVTSFLTTKPASDATDLFVISHGWNNNDLEAHDGLYVPFFTNMRALIQSGTPPFAGRTIAVAVVYWPSKRFDTAPRRSAQGAAADDTGETRLEAQLDELRSLFAGDPNGLSEAAIDEARALIPQLEESETARDRFVAALVNRQRARKPVADEGIDDAFALIEGARLRGSDTLSAIQATANAAMIPPAADDAGAAADASDQDDGGGADVFGNLVVDMKSAASRFLNFFTYYTMKDRAALVGVLGLRPVLERAMASRPMHVHLIGHSFGGRLVTAAANALPDGHAVNSMTLLQAAYSHFGMAKDWDGPGKDGAFRAVLSAGKVAKFVLVTHSTHDSAVSTWYPLASQLMRQAGAAAEAIPRYGGMGGDGAQNTPESVSDRLRGVGEAYSEFGAGIRLRNLDGSGPDPRINDHGDVTKPEIVAAVLEHVARYDP